MSAERATAQERRPFSFTQAVYMDSVSHIVENHLKLNGGELLVVNDGIFIPMNGLSIPLAYPIDYKKEGQPLDPTTKDAPHNIAQLYLYGGEGYLENIKDIYNISTTTIRKKKNDGIGNLLEREYDLSTLSLGRSEKMRKVSLLEQLSDPNLDQIKACELIKQVKIDLYREYKYKENMNNGLFVTITTLAIEAGLHPRNVKNDIQYLSDFIDSNNLPIGKVSISDTKRNRRGYYHFTLISYREQVVELLKNAQGERFESMRRKVSDLIALQS